MEKEKIRGYVFFIFPVDYIIETREVEMTDCWLNNHCLWLFEIINSFVGFFCDLFGVTSSFIISFRGKNKERIKKLE